MGLSEEIKAEIESQLETFKKELKKELQSLFNQRTTDTINGVEEKYLIMSSGMTGALSAATIKFDNATKLISGVTVIDKLDQYGITVDNIHQILDTNRKAFSGFTQSATTLFKKLQEDVESGFTFAVSSVSGIIRTNIESGLSETFLKKTALTSAITEANAQLFDQSKEFTNRVFANASAFTLSKFNEVSSNLGSLSGDVRGLASGFTGLNNQFVFYTPTSAMSGVVLNITNDKFVKQNDFGASVSGIVESVVGDKFAEASALTLTKFDEVANSINKLQNNFNNFQTEFDDINGQINDHGTNIGNLDTQLKSFGATVESITGKVSTFETGIEGFNNKFSTIEGNVGVLTNDFNGMNGRVSTLESGVNNLNTGITEVRNQFNLYTPTEDMNADFILERVNISTIKEKGEFMTQNDIDNYIRNSRVVQEVIGNNYVSRNEFISFSGTVSNKIYGVADGSDIVHP
jgi:archaellum component FlaC